MGFIWCFMGLLGLLTAVVSMVGWSRLRQTRHVSRRQTPGAITSEPGQLKACAVRPVLWTSPSQDFEGILMDPEEKSFEAFKKLGTELPGPVLGISNPVTQLQPHDEAIRVVGAN